MKHKKKRSFIGDVFSKHIDTLSNLTVSQFFKNIMIDSKWYFLVYFSFILIANLLDAMLAPVASRAIINAVQSYSGPMSGIWSVLLDKVVGIVIVAILVSLIIGIGFIVEAYHIEPMLDARIKIAYMKTVMNRNYELSLSCNTGEILGHMYGLLGNAKSIIKLAIRHAIPNFLICCTLGFSLFAIHPFLGMVITGHMIIAIITFTLLAPKAQNLAARAMDSHSRTISAIVDVLLNLQSVLLFARQKHEVHNIDNAQSAESRRIRAGMTYVEKIKLLFSVNTIVMCYIVYLYVEINLYQRGAITLADIIYGLTAIGSYVILLLYVQIDLMDLIRHLGYIKKSLETLNSDIGISEQSIPLSNQVRINNDFNVREGKIEFRNISFAYNDVENLFEEESLIIKPKEKIGLVGRSGSGKTTFINLLLRNLEPDEGKILIDDEDIKNISDDTLRANVSVISQDVTLFNRTILDNIRYAKLDATFEEVLAAARKANAHDFISELEHGYYTHAGERGNRLSGGQRQRIIIARAILKNAPILILDEATSALDIESETIVHESLDNLMAGKTVIAIAHKLQTLKNMDRIVVLEDGVIIEHGTHDDLLSKPSSAYSKFWNLHQESIIVE